MRTYFVYGDYGYVNQTELYDTRSLSEALDWARRYTQGGDLGGYNCIEVAWSADDGEYCTELVIRADDFEEDGFDDDLYGDEPEWELFSD